MFLGSNSSQEELVTMGVYKKSMSVNEETSNTIMSCSNYNNIISSKIIYMYIMCIFDK